MAPLALAAYLAFTPRTMAVPRARSDQIVAWNATVGQNDVVRVVVGGSLQSTSPILDFYRGYPPGGVKYITAAGINPIADAASIGAFFADAGIDIIAAHSGTRWEKIRIQKWYVVYKDHITLEDYEIKDGMGLELYYN